MKKLLVSLLLLIPFCSGCSTISTNLTINKDKSVSVKTLLDFDGNFDDSRDLEALTVLKNYGSFFDEDYKVKLNSGVSASTLQAEKSVKNIFRKDIDLSSLGFESNLSNKKFISVRKNFFVSSYNIDMIYNLPETASEIDFIKADTSNNSGGKSSMTPEYLQKYADKSGLVTREKDEVDDFRANLDSSTYILAGQNAKDAAKKPKKKYDFDINKLNTTFSITLPAPASFNNADVKSGNTYIWNLRKDTPTVIRLQYVVYSGFAMTFFIILGIALLVYFAKRILRHDSLKGVNRTTDLPDKQENQ